MRTNIVLNDELVEEAFRLSEAIATKKDLVETALREYVSTRRRRNLADLKGRIRFAGIQGYGKTR